MSKRVAFVLLLLGTLIAVQGSGQQIAAEPGISPAKRQKIEKLVTMTGIVPVVMDLMKAQMGNVKKMLPWPPKAQDDFATEMLTAITPETFISLVTPVYDKYLSEEDLDGLIAFYQTPLGQKVLKSLPQVSTECRQAGEKWGIELGKRIGEKIARKVQAGDYGPWPPATPQQSKPQP